jgi:hypothetical protein
MREVMEVLAGYESDSSNPSRVRLACLKLANGSLDMLKAEIERASSDYRDVLTDAEYPRYRREVFLVGKAPTSVQKAAVDADWEQYQGWLKR